MSHNPRQQASRERRRVIAYERRSPTTDAHSGHMIDLGMQITSSQYGSGLAVTEHETWTRSVVVERQQQQQSPPPQIDMTMSRSEDDVLTHAVASRRPKLSNLAQIANLQAQITAQVTERMLANYDNVDMSDEASVDAALKEIEDEIALQLSEQIESAAQIAARTRQARDERNHGDQERPAVSKRVSSERGETEFTKRARTFTKHDRDGERSMDRISNRERERERPTSIDQLDAGRGQLRDVPVRSTSAERRTIGMLGAPQAGWKVDKRGSVDEEIISLHSDSRSTYQKEDVTEATPEELFMSFSSAYNDAYGGFDASAETPHTEFSEPTSDECPETVHGGMSDWNRRIDSGEESHYESDSHSSKDQHAVSPADTIRRDHFGELLKKKAHELRELVKKWMAAADQADVRGTTTNAVRALEFQIRSAIGKIRNKKKKLRGEPKSEPPSQMLQDLASQFFPSYGLEGIYGHALEFAKDKNGSKLIFDQIEKPSQSEASSRVFLELVPDIDDLIIHVYGRQVVQKYLDCGTLLQRQVIVMFLRLRVVKLSFDPVGHQIVIRAIQRLEDPEPIMREFRKHVLQLIRNEIGRLVIQACFENSLALHNFINELMVEMPQVLLTTPATFAFKAIIKHAPRRQLKQLVKSVCENVVMVATNSHGQQRMLNMLLRKAPWINRLFCDALKDKIISLSENEEGCQVVQKCVMLVSEADRAQLRCIINEVLDTPDAADKMKIHANAHHVIQTMLEVADPDQRRYLMGEARPESSEPVIEMETAESDRNESESPANVPGRKEKLTPTTVSKKKVKSQNLGYDKKGPKVQPSPDKSKTSEDDIGTRRPVANIKESFMELFKLAQGMQLARITNQGVSKEENDWIDKMAAVISRHPPEFEKTFQENQTKNPAFSFLFPRDENHEFYTSVLSKHRSIAELFALSEELQNIRSGSANETDAHSAQATLTKSSSKPHPSETRRIIIEKGPKADVGFEIVRGPQGGIFVSDVVDYSLAAIEGIVVGDQILELCGINCQNVTQELATCLLLSRPDTLKMLVQFNPDSISIWHPLRKCHGELSLETNLTGGCCFLWEQHRPVKLVSTDVKDWIEKMASVISKHPPDFETTFTENQTENPAFSFMFPGDVNYDFYKSILPKYRSVAELFKLAEVLQSIKQDSPNVIARKEHVINKMATVIARHPPEFEEMVMKIQRDNPFLPIIIRREDKGNLGSVDTSGSQRATRKSATMTTEEHQLFEVQKKAQELMMAEELKTQLPTPLLPVSQVTSTPTLVSAGMLMPPPSLPAPVTKKRLAVEGLSHKTSTASAPKSQRIGSQYNCPGSVSYPPTTQSVQSVPSVVIPPPQVLTSAPRLFSSPVRVLPPPSRYMPPAHVLPSTRQVSPSATQQISPPVIQSTTQLLSTQKSLPSTSQPPWSPLQPLPSPMRALSSALKPVSSTLNQFSSAPPSLSSAPHPFSSPRHPLSSASQSSAPRHSLSSAPQSLTAVQSLATAPKSSVGATTLLATASKSLATAQKSLATAPKSLALAYHPLSAGRHPLSSAQKPFSATRQPGSVAQWTAPSSRQPFPRQPLASTRQPGSLKRWPLPSTRQPFPRQPLASPRSLLPRQPLPSARQPMPSTPQPVPSPRQTAHSAPQPVPSRQAVPSPRQPFPSSRQPVPSSRQPVPYPRQPVPSSRQPVPSSRQPVPSPPQPVSSTRQTFPSTLTPDTATVKRLLSALKPLPSDKKVKELDSQDLKNILANLSKSQPEKFKQPKSTTDGKQTAIKINLRGGQKTANIPRAGIQKPVFQAGLRQSESNAGRNISEEWYQNTNIRDGVHQNRDYELKGDYEEENKSWAGKQGPIPINEAQRDTNKGYKRVEKNTQHGRALQGKLIGGSSDSHNQDEVLPGPDFLSSRASTHHYKQMTQDMSSGDDDEGETDMSEDYYTTWRNDSVERNHNQNTNESWRVDRRRGQNTRHKNTSGEFSKETDRSDSTRGMYSEKVTGYRRAAVNQRQQMNKSNEDNAQRFEELDAPEEDVDLNIWQDMNSDLVRDMTERANFTGQSDNGQLEQQQQRREQGSDNSGMSSKICGVLEGNTERQNHHDWQQRSNTAPGVMILNVKWEDGSQQTLPQLG